MFEPPTKEGCRDRFLAVLVAAALLIVIAAVIARQAAEKAA